jgi:hypothetical protein
VSTSVKLNDGLSMILIVRASSGELNKEMLDQLFSKIYPSMTFHVSFCYTLCYTTIEIKYFCIIAQKLCTRKLV